METQEEKPRKIKVVKKLPLVPARVVRNEKGELFNLITTEEALAKIMVDV